MGEEDWGRKAGGPGHSPHSSAGAVWECILEAPDGRGRDVLDELVAAFGVGAAD